MVLFDIDTGTGSSGTTAGIYPLDSNDVCLYVDLSEGVRKTTEDAKKSPIFMPRFFPIPLELSYPSHILPLIRNYKYRRL